MIEFGSDNCWFSILSFACTTTTMIWVLIDWLTLGIVIKCYFVLYKAMNACIAYSTVVVWLSMMKESYSLRGCQHNSASSKHSLHLFQTYPLNFHFLWFRFIPKSSIRNYFTYFTGVGSVVFTSLQRDRLAFTHNSNW